MGDPAPRFGWSSGYGEEAAARERALLECRESVSGYRELGFTPRGACRLFAIEDRIVWDFQRPTARAREDCMAVPAVQSYVRYLEIRAGRGWRRWAGRNPHVLRFRITLDRTGEILALEPVRIESTKHVQRAVDEIQASQPLFPLFGELGCLEGVPFEIEVGPDRPS